MENDDLSGEGGEAVLRVDEDDPDLDMDEDMYYSYRGELFTGEMAEYEVPTGALIALVEYRNGKPDGWYRLWYPDGTPKSESFVADHRVRGVAKQWHPNGALSEERFFENGELVEVREWDEDGALVVRPPVTNGFPIPDSPEQAARYEKRRLGRVRHGRPLPSRLLHIAAVDLRYLDPDTLAASVVVVEAESLEQVESATARHPIRTHRAEASGFEEVLAEVEVLRGITIPPGVIMCPGNGPNHTAELNLATHLGVVTDKPTFGVADSPYLGTYTEPGPERGAWTELVDDGAVIGRALRTREGEKPVFITYGQWLGLDEAVELTLRLTLDSRLPAVSIAAAVALRTEDDA